MLNKSRFAALPSLKGNRIKMTSATIAIITITARRNIVEFLFITVFFVSTPKLNKYLLINNKYLLLIEHIDQYLRLNTGLD